MGIVASEDAEVSSNVTEATGNIIDATVAFTGTAYHYYHGNERMDVEYITDGAGQVVNGYTYDAFGTIITSWEKLQNRYTYNGEAFDKTTEQYYLRKRFYNPKLSRFLQEDEYRGDGLNLYAFCANNPVMYVDPSGYVKSPYPLFVEPGTNWGKSDSTYLKKNILGNVGIGGSPSTGSHQAQHLIPQQVYWDSAFLKDIGFYVDHQQNGIFDINKNNSSTVVNDLFNDVSDNLTNRYVSENTHHNGRHDLYSNAVEAQIEIIESKMMDKKTEWIKKGYSTEEIDAMYLRESRKQVHEFIETLRVMNQDGIDLYAETKGSDNKFKDQLEYDEYFNEEMKKAKKKCSIGG